MITLNAIIILEKGWIYISWLVLIIALKFQNVEFYVISTIAGMLATIFYIVLYNQMMIYVENNAYKKLKSKTNYNFYKQVKMFTITCFFEIL